jgi:hypothetical protein
MIGSQSKLYIKIECFIMLCYYFDQSFETYYYSKGIRRVIKYSHAHLLIIFIIVIIIQKITTQSLTLSLNSN